MNQSIESTASAAEPSFNPRELMQLYVAGRFDDLSDKFLSLLGHFEQATYVTLSPAAQYFVNAFVKHFLNLFTQPDYVIAERHVLPFLRQNLTISNLVSVSSFGHDRCPPGTAPRPGRQFHQDSDSLLRPQLDQIRPPHVLRCRSGESVDLVQHVLPDLSHGPHQRVGLPEPARTF